MAEDSKPENNRPTPASDVGQELQEIQQHIQEVTPLVKGFQVIITNLFDGIPWIGGFIAGAANFWFQQQIFTSIFYFVVAFFVFDLILPLRRSVRTRLKPYVDEFGHWLVDKSINLLKRCWVELNWRLSRKERKFIQFQGYACDKEEVEGLKREQAPLLKDIFVPLELTSVAGQRPLHSQERFNQAQDGEPIWRLLALGNTDPNYRQLLIKAKGGYGKTTLLRHIVYTYAFGRLRRGVPQLWPVFIRLRDWDHRLVPQAMQADVEDLPFPDLAGLIQDLVSQPPLKHYQFPQNWAQQKLQEGKMLILWDGFDEIKPEWQGAVSEWLGQQMTNYRGNYFILSTRPHWYDQSYSANATRPAVTIYIKEFNDDQIERFIRQWYRVHFQREALLNQQAYPQDVIAGQVETRTQDLVQQLQARPEIGQLAKIPLNLNMIVNLHRATENAELPRRRALLYQEIMDLQLVKRPKARDIDMVLQEPDRQAVLENVALWLGEQGEKQVTEADLTQHVAQFIKSLGYPARTSVQRFLDNVVEVSEILVKADQQLEFAHLSFQSYLIAQALSKQDQGEAILLQHWQGSDWWRDAARLYAAAQRNPAPFLERLVKLDDPDATGLAKDCLQEIPKERIEPAFLEQLTRLTETVQTSLYAQLETYLKNGQWREADEETARVMLQVVGKEADQWLSPEDIQNFPCEDLQTIDQLWVQYSNGKFGFSVQKQVWLACGGVPGEYDYDVYKKFADEVGWRVDGDWVSYSKLTFDLTGMKAHLPVGAHLPEIGGWGGGGVESGVWSGISFLAQRLVTCNIQQIETNFYNKT